MTQDRRKIRFVPFGERISDKREVDGEIDAVNWLLEYLAGHLPQESPTAKAVRRSGSWEEILRLAQWEGALEIAALLEEAFDTLISDKTSRLSGKSRESR